MKKHTSRLLALLLAVFLTLGCPALAEDAPEAAEAVEAPLEEAPAEAESPAEEPPAEEEFPAEDPARPEAPAEEIAPEEAPEEAEEAPEEVPDAPETPDAEAAEPDGEALTEASAQAAVPEGLVIEDGVVKDYTGEAEELVIPAGVTAIANGACSYCDSLKRVTFPSTLTSIGERAFQMCDNLAVIDLPEGLTSIGESAFAYCESLKSLRIPGSVTTMDNYAFAYCPSLGGSMTIPNGITYVKEGVFKDCASLTRVVFPDNLEEIGYSAFQGCSSLAEADIPGGVDIIHDHAFEACRSLKRVELPKFILSIGQYAFSGCDSIKTVTIPGNLPKVTRCVFSGCDSLTSVVVQSGVSTLYDYAFSGCPNLASVYIPGSVSSFGDGVFKNCDRLTIYGNAGSRAETYAGQNYIPFKAIADVYNVSANVERIPAKEVITFTVRTPLAANYLAMFSENGAKVKTWSKTGNSTESSPLRIWTVQYAISNPGSRELTFKCAVSDTYGEGASVSVRVLAARPAVTSASVSPTAIEKGQTATFTVVTPKAAKYVALYSESGAKVKSWGYSGYSTLSGSTRTWTIPYAISGAGNRTLTFKCCADGYGFYGEGKTVALNVTAPLPAVTSVSASPTTVNARQDVTFTVKTPSTAKYLAMFSESGGKVKVWGMTGNSTVSGGVRTWVVTYAIASKGNRALTFKCSANGTYGAGKTVNITVK